MQQNGVRKTGTERAAHNRPGDNRSPPAGFDPHAARQRREARQGAVVSFVVLSGVFVVAFWFAPFLDATPFWVDHFPDESSRTGLLLYGPLLLAAVLTRAWRALSWESELAAQGAKALAHVALFWWMLVPLLDAPVLAAIVVLPLLMASPLMAAHVARRARWFAPAPRRWLRLAPTLSGLTGLLLAAWVWIAPPLWLFVFVALPLGAIFLLLPPVAVAKARRWSPKEPAGPGEAPVHPDPAGVARALDLPEGTLRPPGGWVGLVVAVSALGFVLFVVAPGLPLTAPIAWGALVAALPLVARALVVRGGVVHPRAVPGPPSMRRHESQVMTITDETLQDLDDAAKRFLDWGRGRRHLAVQMAGLWEGADPRATPRRIEAQLARLPRRVWARRARQDGLVRLLREGADAFEGEVS